MNKKEVKKAPILRFKGFTNDWEQRKFTELGKLYYGKSAPKWSVVEKGGTPCIRYGELYTKYSSKIDNVYSHTSIDKSKLKFSTGNELLIPRVGEEPLDFAKHTSWLSIPNVAIGEMITVLKTKENPLFLANYLRAKYVFKFARLVEGGNVSNLYFERYEDTNILIPSKNEQQNISKLILKIDKLITLQQRKLELLKLFKIGMLQNILADTKAASKLKFKGSNQEWRPRRLNSITNIITKGTTPHFKQASNGVNFIKIEDISKDNGKIYPRSFITEKENNGYLKRSQLKAGDLLFSIAGTLGRVGKVTDDILPANTNQALAIIRLKPSQNIDFCKIMLESDSVKRYIHANPTMGAQPNLSLKQISDLTLFFPDIKEQTLISQLIKKIDNLLALQYQNISKFKQLKQFLLQNIFI